jgi:hypothetical protein
MLKNNCTHKKKEKKVDHTSHCEQAAKKSRGMLRGTFVKIVPMMFVEHTTGKNTIFA